MNAERLGCDGDDTRGRKGRKKLAKCKGKRSEGGDAKLRKRTKATDGTNVDDDAGSK
jgi:hypothetical protein